MRLFAKAKSLFYFEIKTPKSKVKHIRKRLDKHNKIITQNQREYIALMLPFLYVKITKNKPI